MAGVPQGVVGYCKFLNTVNHVYFTRQLPTSKLQIANCKSLTEQLAHFLSHVDRDALPLDAAKYYVLDWLGSALAGTQTPQGKMLLDYAAAQTAAVDGCDVIGLQIANRKSQFAARSADIAALTNGGLSHIVEMDDLDRGSVLHPGTVVIPAALAVAQREQKSGQEFLQAIVLGYEVAIRIGEAVGRSHYQYFHNTATCGVFGAAVAAANLLGLSEEQIVWALGNAGTMSAGLWEFNADGAMSKHLHAGRAAQSGVLAADLARRGFTGARRILEGERGFFAATSKDANPAKATESLDPEMTAWKISGVSIKPHASCRHTHPAIDAALKIRAGAGLPRLYHHIKRIELETYQAALDLCDNPAPVTAYQAKFSLQYCVAVALLRGHAGLADFTPEQISDESVARLIARTTVHHNPTFEQVYPRQWPSNVTVAFVDGRVFSQTINTPKGDPENPLSQRELQDKFRQMLSGTSFEAERWIDFVRGLDRVAAIVLPET